MIPTYLWITCMVIVISFLQSTDGGVKVSLLPSTVDLKTQQPHKIYVVCSLEENTRINTIHLMKILRKSKWENAENEFKVIAQTKSDQSPEIPSSAPWDIKDRITGINLYKPASSQIKLEFNAADMVCEDKGIYKCTAEFDDAHGKPVIEEATDALEVRSLYIGWDAFQCYVKCFGGTAAIGYGGIMALIALLPTLGFGAGGVVAGTVAAKLMALYGGAVPAGGWFATFQSIGAAGISYTKILEALYGSTKVASLVTGACSSCLKLQNDACK